MIQASQTSAPVIGASRTGAADAASLRFGAVPRRPSDVPSERQALDQAGEGAALSAAIQRLIAERDRHKGLAAAQENELIRLRAINDELRRQNEEISAARDRYLGLAAELLAQLQQVDAAIHGAIQNRATLRRAETRRFLPSPAAFRPRALVPTKLRTTDLGHNALRRRVKRRVGQWLSR